MARRSKSQPTRWWVRSRIPLGLFLLLPTPIHGQRLKAPISNSDEHESGIIEGRVQAVNGRAIPTIVTLKLMTPSGETVSERPATTNGQFDFSNLRHIAYVLTVSADGFETSQQLVDLGRSGGMVTLNIFLQPAPKAPPPIVASGSLTDTQAPKNARKELEKGEQALGKRDLSAARSHLAKAVQEFPCYARAQTELAMVLGSEAESREAEAALKKAIECDPGFADAYLQLGLVYISQKNYQASLTELTEGTRHAPAAWQFYFQIGIAHYALGQFHEAEQDFLKAQSFNPPQQEDIQIKLADVYLKEGQYGKAYSEMQTYLAANPQGRFAEKIKDIMHQMESTGAVHPATARTPTPAPKP
jgi:Flp pilus assembly protein TadD